MGRGSSKAGGGGGANQAAVNEIVFSGPAGRSHAKISDEVTPDMTARTFEGTQNGYDIYRTNTSPIADPFGYTAVKRGQSVSGKPFDANDWTTWTVGTKVETANDDIYASGRRVASGPQRTRTGTVTEVHDNYIVVTDFTNTRNYVDKDIAPRYKVRK